VAASLEVARTVCRRAERQICRLQKEKTLGNDEILVFLNRLSDVLWLLARWAEFNEGKSGAVDDLDPAAFKLTSVSRRI
jgi:cob(I)alamin adenosyltransferase